MSSSTDNPNSASLITPNKGVPPSVSDGLEKFIATLIFPGEPTKYVIPIETMFNHWHVTTWTDLGYFSQSDIEKAIKDLKLKDFGVPILVKKLGMIFQYSKLHPLPDHSTTMNDITHAVHSKTGPPTTNPSSTINSTKKTVPDLDVFSGGDEDFLEYRDSVINQLGQAGLGHALTDTKWCKDHPDLSEAVFFALRQSIHKGTAKHVAQKLYEAKNYSSHQLWLDLTSQYDTALNKANLVLFAVKKLLRLQLHPGILPDAFIADFESCLGQLRTTKAKLADDNDTLRALLLVAIQDDEFDNVRRDIVKNPELTATDILKEIHDRDQSLNMIDDARKAKHSRRLRSTDSKKPSDNPSEANPRKWWIPKFPSSWKKAMESDKFGVKIFSVLTQWRHDVIKQKSQAELDKAYSMIVEGYTPNNKRSRRASAEKSTTQETSKTDEESQNDSESTQIRKRIRFTNSRKIITEPRT